MTKEKRLKAKIKRLQAELNGLPPIDRMGVRELARASGVSPTTAMRAKHGETLDMETIKKLLPFLSKCPCCNQPLRNHVEMTDG